MDDKDLVPYDMYPNDPEILRRKKEEKAESLHTKGLLAIIEEMEMDSEPKDYRIFTTAEGVKEFEKAMAEAFKEIIDKAEL